MANNVKKTDERTIVLGTVLVATCSVIAVVLLPAAPTHHGAWWSGHIPIAIAVIATDLFLGTALFLLRNLSVYRPRFRALYRLITASAVLVAIGAAISLYAQAADSVFHPWALLTMGTPFVLSGLLSYTAARRLGHMVSYDASATRKFLEHACAVTLAALILTAQSRAYAPSALELFSNATLLIGGFYNIFAGQIIIRLGRNMGTHYKDAILLLGASFCAGGATVALYELSRGFTSPPSALVMACVNTGAVATGALFMRASFAFSKLKEY